MTLHHTDAPTRTYAPGLVVVVRDEEWLITKVENSHDGHLLTVTGLSDLVKDTTAMFYTDIDDVTVLDPCEVRVELDTSPGHTRAKLWLEATIRATPLAVDDPTLSTSRAALADALDYQLKAVTQALDPRKLRPRILLSDAVGLGKTLEIGMILAELARRGRGDRILIVTPRHVLEQMQHELWCRFALPFIRLDSVGIQRVRQELPASRNPFSKFKRVIISIDTLKNDRYFAHLRRHHWDAVVIDESHAVTNSNTHNNRLARVLAPNTDALILASATPHNGKAESFAELIRLLEPSAVRPDGTLVPEDLERLVVRRHRNSPDVASEVGADWAPRQDPINLLIPASPAEDALAAELATTWLHPVGSSPYSGATSALFPWTLAKAFLSSPDALRETIKNRQRSLSDADPAQAREASALRVLDGLAAAIGSASAKYQTLLKELDRIGICTSSPERVVIFAERVPTLTWLQQQIRKDLKLPDDAVQILHGSLTDQEQQRIVEEFKRGTSPLRVLVTGDVASEGVNLHQQCHELIHYDIPWSLIRLEQRNGRIDRYGQKHSPRITSLLLNPSHEQFSGDLRVLSRLIAKEHEAHQALGDVASLMGKYSVGEEEEQIKAVLAGKTTFDDVVHSAADVLAAPSHDPLAYFAQISQAASPNRVASDVTGTGLFASDVEYLRESLRAIYHGSHELPQNRGGVGWVEHLHEHIVEFIPPTDLQRRLSVLPQSYLQERRVTERLLLTTSKQRGKRELERARASLNSTWPEAHYLGPLHPVLEWAGDAALASIGRGTMYAVRAAVDNPTVLVLGTLLNRRGLTVTSSWMTVEFPFPSSGLVTQHQNASDAIAALGLNAPLVNTGAPIDAESYQPLVQEAVRKGGDCLHALTDTATRAAEASVTAWSRRVDKWEHDAAALIPGAAIKTRRVSVEQEKDLARLRLPDRQLVRPFLLVLPVDV